MTTPPNKRPEGYWRSLVYLNIYRLIIAVLLLGMWFVMEDHSSWASYDTRMFVFTALSYFLFGTLSLFGAKFRWPNFNRQLTLQVLGDIAFITALMNASGGIKSGFGLLMVIAIAAASLVSQGRLALFYAAVASIAVLLEQSWQILAWNEKYEDYTQAVMLSLSFFATAWLAHYFALRTRESEALASQRGIDIANLAEVNQLVIRDMSEGVLVVDSQLNLRQLNESARSLLVLTEETSVNTPLENSSPALARVMRDWIENGPGTEGSDRISIGGRDLQLRLVSVGNARNQGVVLFIRDLSLVQMQAQQLKLAALGRLTANIAHEIRNPLSAIGHASQLLLEESNTGSASHRLLSIIENNVKRLDGMVQDVLQLNRRDRARQEKLDFNHFIEEFRIQFCQVENIPVEHFLITTSENQTVVIFDKDQLHQILWNLCRNAWRHGCKLAGSLKVNYQVSRGRVQINVCDDGPGVSKDSLPHLFEPFFTTETSGTGLGLYIARELCEANQARIEYVDSPQGAIFRLYARREQ